MTKRLLAIALVVLVAVSAMYLPSVLNVSAADTTVTVDKPTYDGTIKAYTVTVNGNTTQIANLSAADIADEASLKKAIEREMPSYKDQVGTAVINGTTVTVTLAKTLSIKAQAKTSKSPDALVDLATIDALVGSPVTEFTAKLPTPPTVFNKIFTNWNIQSIDTNYDGKIDDGVKTIEAVYAPMGASASAPYTINVYTATAGAEASKLVAGTYDLGTAVPVKSFSLTPELFAADAAIAESAVVAAPEVNSAADGGYVFSYWLVRNTTKTENNITTTVYNAKDYVAIYKKAATAGTYTYTFKDGVSESVTQTDFGKVENTFFVQTNTLTNNPYDLLDADQKKVIADYLGDAKTIKSWKLATGADGKFIVTLETNELYDYTYYYVDANGNYAKTVKKYDNDAAALGFDAGAAKGHTFVRWNKVANEKVFNGFYNVGEPVVEVVLPEAKKGNDSFAFSSTATPKTAKYKKTMTARVTAGKGTFNKAEVKLVNKSVKLSANAINCTVKKGTMKETSGTPYTITFNKKGTAYVVVSIAYNGNVYTKTLTKTVK